jgi:hypothetical protein
MIWCGQHMLYFRPQFALSHTHEFESVGVCSEGCAWIERTPAPELILYPRFR